MAEYVLAIDLGGTNTRFGIVSQDGEITARSRANTVRGSRNEIAEFLVGQLRDLSQARANGKIIAIAAAVPAVFDHAAGRKIRFPNIPELEQLDLASLFSRHFHVQAFLENDATAATIGEHWRGASRGFDNVIGITLGTGVGGGLIINNRPYRGTGGSAGEIGHICVEPDGLACSCGSHGCLEQYASGTAIVREARDAGLNVVDAEAAYQLFSDGNERIRSIFDEAGRYLGIALSGLVNVVNPDAITIGGGVSGAWDAFQESMNREMLARSFDAPARHVKIIKAELGDDAGLLGAARVAFTGLADAKEPMQANEGLRPRS